MELDLNQLAHLITKRNDKIEKLITGSGYKLKTVLGVGTFLLDNEGDIDLLTSRQQVTFERFLKPLLQRR